MWVCGVKLLDEIHNGGAGRWVEEALEVFGVGGDSEEVAIMEVFEEVVALKEG